MHKFSAHFANWYSVMESAANVDLDDSEPGPWPNLRTMFQYKGKTENSVKFSCLPEPGKSTLNVLNYKYKYFPPQKYLSTSTFLFGEMYLSTFRVLSKCT